MGSEHTKKQMKKEFDQALHEANNPDLGKLAREKRKKRGKKVAKKYGL